MGRKRRKSGWSKTLALSLTMSMTKKALCKQIFQSVKKQFLVLATPLLMTIANIKTDSEISIPNTKALTPMTNNFALPLECILYIYHLVQFKKN